MNEGFSDDLLGVMIYGKLPIIGNLGGPGGKRLGFFVDL